MTWPAVPGASGLSMTARVSAVLKAAPRGKRFTATDLARAYGWDPRAVGAVLHRVPLAVPVGYVRAVYEGRIGWKMIRVYEVGA